MLLDAGLLNNIIYFTVLPQFAMPIFIFPLTSPQAPFLLHLGAGIWALGPGAPLGRAQQPRAACSWARAEPSRSSTSLLRAICNFPHCSSVFVLFLGSTASPAEVTEQSARHGSCNERSELTRASPRLVLSARNSSLCNPETLVPFLFVIIGLIQ